MTTKILLQFVSIFIEISEQYNMGLLKKSKITFIQYVLPLLLHHHITPGFHPLAKNRTSWIDFKKNDNFFVKGLCDILSAFLLPLAH